MTAQQKTQGGTKADVVVGPLIALAQALKENPWFLSIVLVGYLNGIGLNLYLLNNHVTFFAIFDNLAIGCAWLGLVATIVLVRTKDLFPLTGGAAKKVLIACLLISSGSVMSFVILTGIGNGVQAFAEEFRTTYGHDLRVVLKALLGLLWFILIIWFFAVATRGARDAIASEGTIQ